jgi:hypothetical protein
LFLKLTNSKQLSVQFKKISSSPRKLSQCDKIKKSDFKNSIDTFQYEIGLDVEFLPKPFGAKDTAAILQLATTEKTYILVSALLR